MTIFGLFLSIGWVINLTKLANCDFEPPYKAEIIHGIGVFVPPVGMVVGLLDLGE